MIMSENYFRDRADDCNRLAREESDLEMRGMLCDLELDYRAKALHAAAHGWRDAPRYFELAEVSARRATADRPKSFSTLRFHEPHLGAPGIGDRNAICDRLA
jgi:hypothetical protein